MCLSQTAFRVSKCLSSPCCLPSQYFSFGRHHMFLPSLCCLRSLCLCCCCHQKFALCCFLQLAEWCLIGRKNPITREVPFFLFFFWLQQLFFFFPSLNGICSELDALWGGAGISRYFETANPPEPCGYPKSNFRSSFLYEICCFHQLGINRKGEI